ncbi:glycosyltransferase family 2 protein [candidate division FCPU426 bacterium]|nr:glycosyltransferase family 2 protein [candidate division FCPU426 bacterium]
MNPRPAHKRPLTADPKRPPLHAEIQRYLEKHMMGQAPQAWPVPAPNLRLVIVIPARSERSGLQRVLASLEQGSRHLAETEVIVVVNNPENQDTGCRRENLATLSDLQAKRKSGLKVLALDRASVGKGLPPKQGVGMARRLGMDLALQRLAAAGKSDAAAIASMDADAPVSPGYIDQVLTVFTAGNPPLGGICAFAHPLPQDEKMAEAILQYELWLRYFELGLRLAGSLYAYPTIGSCMVVSARGYALADGMPLRQAGEDFYFWQKLVKASGLRPLARLHHIMVFPEARLSERMPYGTSRALQRVMAEDYTGYARVEAPNAFFELRAFLRNAKVAWQDPESVLPRLAPRLQEYLQAKDAVSMLKKMKKTYPAQRQFTLAVHQWFDGLAAIRYIKARAREEKRVGILTALKEVLLGLNQGETVRRLPRPPSGQAPREVLRLWLEGLRGLRPQVAEEEGR